MKFTKTVLDNGLRIITAPQKDNPAVTVLVLVETGSKYETKDLNGISHFLEHMCFKGTEKRPKAIDISSELDGVGASYNAFTGFEYTGYYAKVGKDNLDKALDIVSDIYLHQIFDPEEIKKESGVIIEELNMYEDLPMRRVQELFTNLLYGDQPAGWDIGGRKEVIERIKRDDFIKYRKEHYVASATSVVIAGSIDEDKVLEKAKKAFAGISAEEKSGKPKVKESQEEPAMLVKNKESDQTHLVLGVRAYDIFDDRIYIADVMADILGGGMSSRLWRVVRGEMGAAYYVGAENDSLTDHGYLVASAGVNNKKLLPVVKAILKEFEKLKEERVGEEELKKTKKHIVGRLMLGLETSNAVASFYGMQEILKKEIISPEELTERINSVTSEQIKDVANEIFTNDRLNLAVIGPVGDEKTLREALQIA
jgi:predicted Zn-dependent peptidase